MGVKETVKKLLQEAELYNDSKQENETGKNRVEKILQILQQAFGA